MQTQQRLESIYASSSQATPALEGIDTTNLPKLPPATETESQGQEVTRQISEFFEQLPEYLSNFFKDSQQALVTVALIFAAIVTVKITLAVLAAIHDIPLLSPTFELIGIAYATWFVSRYLIKASNRQELAEKIQLLKNEVVGD